MALKSEKPELSSGSLHRLIFHSHRSVLPAALGNLRSTNREWPSTSSILIFICILGWSGNAIGQDGLGSVAQSWSLPLLLNTLALAFYVSVLVLPIGVSIAFLVARTDLIGRRIFEIVLYAMLFVPTYLHVAAWDAGFGLQGWASQNFGLRTVILEGWRGAVWVYFVTLLPWVVLIQATFLRLVPQDLEDQARIDSTDWQVIRHVTLRASLPGVIVSLFWIFIQVSNEVTITDVYQIRTYAEEVYTGFALGDTLVEVQTRILPGVGFGLPAGCLLLLFDTQGFSGTNVFANRHGIDLFAR